MDFNYLYEKIKAHDSVSLVSFIDMLDDISNQNYSISYNPRDSWCKHVKLSLAHNKIDYITNNKVNQNMSFDKHNRRSFKKQENHAILMFENMQTYQQQLVKNISYGMKDAEAHIIKFQMAFEGQYKTEYELNLAYAESHLSNVSRILALMRNSTTSPLEPKAYSVIVHDFY